MPQMIQRSAHDDGQHPSPEPRHPGTQRFLRPGIGRDPREDAYVLREADPKLLHRHGERAPLDMDPARRWRNFLMIDSCMPISLHICKAGYLQILIPDTDLVSFEFSRTYAAVESS
jgi:hypothetical protein